MRARIAVIAVVRRRAGVMMVSSCGRQDCSWSGRRRLAEHLLPH